MHKMKMGLNKTIFYKVKVNSVHIKLIKEMTFECQLHKLNHT